MVEDPAFPALQSREELDRLLGDCAVLLDYLTGVPDARLDWCFEETRIRSAGTPPTRIVAPPAATPTKAGFLERLTGLHCQIQAATTGGPPIGAADIAFLMAARDFLSTLARPVTVQTIRITREYVRPARYVHDLLQSVAALFGRHPEGPKPQRSERFGRQLASRVGFCQVATVVIVGVTVLLSIYALIGRGLVLEVRALDAQFAALGADLAKAEQEDAPTFVIIAGGVNDVVAQMPRPHWRHYCNMGEDAKGPRGYVSRQQQRLCDRYDGYNEKFAQLFGRLHAWRELIPGRWFPGMDPAPRKSPEDARAVVTVAAVADQAKPDAAPTILQTLQRDRLELVNADVVLRATAEYLLPCLYALLGALAATLRHIARRVEEVTLDYSDGGVVIRTPVLGVLFGAVIGLFASQLGPATEGANTAAASLTPAALSLLAGYSVAQVFQFFDGLALRVFGPSQGKAPAG